MPSTAFHEKLNETQPAENSYTGFAYLILTLPFLLSRGQTRQPLLVIQGWDCNSRVIQRRSIQTTLKGVAGLPRNEWPIWSGIRGYGSYLKGKGLTGLKTESVMGYFSGSRSRQLRQYRDYVEGDGSEKTRNPAPEVIKQIFIGDDDFTEATRRRGNRSSVHEGHYSFQQMVEAVSAVMGADREEFRTPKAERESPAKPGDVMLHCRRYNPLFASRRPGFH